MSCSVAARSSLTVSVVSGAASGFGNVAIVSSSSIDAGSSFFSDEAVALTKGGDLVRVDAIDELIEVFAQARIGPRAVRRLEQDIDRAIEFRARAFEMPDVQFPFAGFEMRLR